MASGLSMPVGFKNLTSGDVGGAINAVIAAQSPHAFLSMTRTGAIAAYESTGNPVCHLILRGGTQGPNASDPQVKEVVGKLEAAGLTPHLMIDCSHSNSGKKVAVQRQLCLDLAERIGAGDQAIMGIMLESFIEEGNQELGRLENLQYGLSITDPCLDWETTKECLTALANAVAQSKKQ